MTEKTTRPFWTTFMLVALPLWLILSGAAALWYYFHLEREEALKEQERFAQSISLPRISEDMRKLIGLIGERNTSSEDSSKGLTQTAALIEGSLGPTNVGFKVVKTKGPADWPLIQFTIRGKENTEPVWVLTSYDSRAGSPGVEANATGIAASLAVAQALAHDKPDHPIHFLFIPHANDLDAPVLETIQTAQTLIKNAGSTSSILCVESMGAGEHLWLSTRAEQAKPIDKVEGLGDVYGAEVVCLGDDVDLASMLSQMDLPAVRVATRAMLPPDELDEKLPDPVNLTGSSGRLVELIRRSAAKN